jgi:hypothetical protein
MKPETIFVTKYALTKGVMTYPKDHDGDCFVVVKDKNGLNGTAIFHGKDWHLTMEAAQKRAEEMRIKKVASLKKQIKELENLKF